MMNENNKKRQKEKNERKKWKEKIEQTKIVGNHRERKIKKCRKAIDKISKK